LKNIKAKKALIRGLFLLVELKLGLNLFIKILFSFSAVLGKPLKQ
jgi:hypothetical protein